MNKNLSNTLYYSIISEIFMFTNKNKEMVDEYLCLKTQISEFTSAFSRQLAAKGVTANQVTLIACLLSILLGVVLALFPTFSSLFFLIPIWFFLRMALKPLMACSHVNLIKKVD